MPQMRVYSPHQPAHEGLQNRTVLHDNSHIIYTCIYLLVPPTYHGTHREPISLVWVDHVHQEFGGSCNRYPLTVLELIQSAKRETRQEHHLKTAAIKLIASLVPRLHPPIQHTWEKRGSLVCQVTWKTSQLSHNWTNSWIKGKTSPKNQHTYVVCRLIYHSQVLPVDENALAHKLVCIWHTTMHMGTALTAPTNNF